MDNEISKKEKLMIQIVEEVNFYADEVNENEVYAEFSFDDHTEFCSISSPRLYAFLNVYFRSFTSDFEMVNFKPLINVKRDETILFGSKVKVHTRIAGNENRICFFLADDSWHSVVISPKGWKILQQTKYKFIKKPNTKEQVFPKNCKKKTLDELLRKFINMEEESYVLFKIALIQYFFPNSSHYIAIISSEHGTGKSTITKLIRELIDPSVANVSFIPDNPEEIKNHLANNMVVAFDNTKHQKDIISDILCSAVTGSSFTKRTLYTTAEETILNVHNIVILNGINIVPNKSDLLERSILFELKKIPSAKRKTDKKFWDTFNKYKPYILGEIFSIISIALGIRKDLSLKKTHRMSDAYTDMVAIAMAMGYTEEDFSQIFYSNRNKLEKAYSDGNYFVSSIVEYMEECRNNKPIENTMTHIYQLIKTFKKGDIKFFPKSASAFSRKLKEEESSLKLAGYKIYIDPKKDATYLKIEKIKEREKSKNASTH
ncbi:MAG: hypothetical protein IKB70_10245 [Bacilli bacterium]|nr:hypothetical protein [Bacilli bacterium]